MQQAAKSHSYHGYEIIWLLDNLRYAVHNINSESHKNTVFYTSTVQKYLYDLSLTSSLANSNDWNCKL